MGTIVGSICFICARVFNSIRPQYSQFELVKDDIKTCLDMTGRAIMISGWLAAVARRELSRFKEFISFIRHGRVRLSPLMG
jgi:hypothetical protein